MHREIHADLEEWPKLYAVAAPRGTAKSTNITFLRTMHAIAFRLEEFILVISGTEEQSVAFLQDLRNEFSTNDIFCELFDLTLTRESMTVLEINGKMFIQARGRGQKIRGRRYKHLRPTLILLDDAEDDESVSTPEQREKVDRWFWRQVFPAIHRQKGKIWVVGTILESHSLLAKLIKNKSFKSKLFSITTNGKIDGESIWPDMFPKKVIMSMYNAMKRSGREQDFFTEMMNKPLMDENRRFKASYLDFYDYKTRHELMSECRVYMTVDLARKAGANNDDTAIVIVAVHPDGGRYVLSIDADKTDAPETVKRVVDAIATYRPHAVGIEEEAFYLGLKGQIDSELRRRRLYVIIEPIKHDNKRKTDRIMNTLLPQFKLKEWKFPKNKPAWYMDFLSQYLEFNHTIKENEADDILDAMAMLEKLLIAYPTQRYASSAESATSIRGTAIKKYIGR